MLVESVATIPMSGEYSLQFASQPSFASLLDRMVSSVPATIAIAQKV
jgi:hypothetical protein